MARKKQVDDDELIAKLAQVFRDYGYDGASLNILSEAAGLKKASLYHRFPGGKEQMALEVLNKAKNWFGENIVAPLKSDLKTEKKIQIMVEKLNELYSGGYNSCLLNMLSTHDVATNPFTDQIRESFKVWIKTISDVLIESGMDPDESRARAENAVAMIQGTLVMSRGMNDKRPFKNLLKSLPGFLIVDNN